VALSLDAAGAASGPSATWLPSGRSEPPQAVSGFEAAPRQAPFFGLLRFAPGRGKAFPNANWGFARSRSHASATLFLSRPSAAGI